MRRRLNGVIRCLNLKKLWGDSVLLRLLSPSKKVINRFTECSNEFRDATNRVAMRQALAHPMSEFLGTLLIVVVLWFGGSLILGNHSSIDAPTFIFYMVILYSVINPFEGIFESRI